MAATSMTMTFLSFAIGSRRLCQQWIYCRVDRIDRKQHSDAQRSSIVSFLFPPAHLSLAE